MTLRRNGNMLLNILAEIRTLRTLLLLLCCLLCDAGDETLTLQEVEGTTITLHTGITGIQSDAQIQWFYGPEKAEKKILNSQVFKGETVTEISERFKERLQLDRISGALTIRNISRNDSGVYLVQVITERLSSRTFSVSVYGLLCEAGDETLTLQEVEGTTITLHTGITGIQSDAQIVWLYGPEKAEKKILNSQVFKGETVTEISERFKERLQLDRISGALTIRNISRNDSGVYMLHVLTEHLSSRTFSVSVYAPVSAPVIINQRGKRSVSSTEQCFLLCTVENGEDVNLSWYRENERISITNNTDLSVPLNLPLQIQHHDKNTNTSICVSANPVSYKTSSLNTTQLCYHNSAPVLAPVIINQRGKRSVSSTEPCFLLCTVENGEDVNLSWYRENERISITNNTDLSVPPNLPLQIQHHDKNTNTYICVSANPVSYKTSSLNTTKLCYHNSGLLCEAGDETLTLQEVEGTTITLHTGITGIQSDARIVWIYGPEKAEKKILFSHVFKGETVTEISERFKERLQLDRISGALTIRNISRNDSGVYMLHVLTEHLSSRSFSVSVY
ncbi:hypothetical protein QTP70_016048, partial [Hemibagrus guttatus]